jgi:hypothetical protein
MRLPSPNRSVVAPLQACAGRHNVLRPRLRPQWHLHTQSRQYANPSDPFDILQGEPTGPRIRDGNIAVIGGGLGGLTTAYYLAKFMPPTTKITILESSDRLGGWIRTDKFDVDIAGKKGKIRFERGPRTMSTQKASRHRIDNMVLYELVRPRPSPADLVALTCDVSLCPIEVIPSYSSLTINPA